MLVFNMKSHDLATSFDLYYSFDCLQTTYTNKELLSPLFHLHKLRNAHLPDPPVVVPTDPPVVTPTNPPVASCGAKRASCSTGGECCSGSCSIDRKGNGKCA